MIQRLVIRIIINFPFFFLIQPLFDVALRPSDILLDNSFITSILLFFSDYERIYDKRLSVLLERAQYSKELHVPEKHSHQKKSVRCR